MRISLHHRHRECWNPEASWKSSDWRFLLYMYKYPERGRLLRSPRSGVGVRFQPPHCCPLNGLLSAQFILLLTVSCLLWQSLLIHVVQNQRLNIYRILVAFLCLPLCFCLPPCPNVELCDCRIYLLLIGANNWKILNSVAYSHSYFLYIYACNFVLKWILEFIWPLWCWVYVIFFLLCLVQHYCAS